ncbi:MAG TPA: hypothetical protein PLM34_09415 [Lentimicrobium sp.]|nr:hypothetical protein [Lentimicrobium sp.]
MQSLRKIIRFPVFLSILFLLAGCKNWHQYKTGLNFPLNIFAQLKGQLSDGEQQIRIERYLATRAQREMAVISKIETKNTLSGHPSLSVRYIRDYFDGDSLYIYDTADSSCMVLAAKDISPQNFEAFPYTAWWLLISPEVKSEPDSADLKFIAGYKCKKTCIKGGVLWNYEQQPMAIETINNGFLHNEIVTIFVTDTIVQDSLFIRPSGYRRIAPYRE